MTQLSSICKALLAGETLSIMDGFQKFSCTNLPREISRSVEKKFNVEVSKVRKEGISRYGQPITWKEYRLNRTLQNSKGITDMAKYIQEVGGNPKSGAKTQKELK